MDGETLEELVLRVMSGDRAAEDALVNRLSAGLLAILRKYVGDEHAAWDTHQEAFCIVITRLRGRGIDQPAAIKAFLRQTAINVAKKHFRRPGEEHLAPDAPLVDPQPDPLDRLCAEELAALAGQVLEELGPRDREILRRFYVYEETRATIMSALGVTYEHVDRLTSRARKRLRKLARERYPQHFENTRQASPTPPRTPPRSRGRDSDDLTPGHEPS